MRTQIRNLLRSHTRRRFDDFSSVGNRLLDLDDFGSVLVSVMSESEFCDIDVMSVRYDLFTLASFVRFKVREARMIGQLIFVPVSGERESLSSFFGDRDNLTALPKAMSESGIFSRQTTAMAFGPIIEPIGMSLMNPDALRKILKTCVSDLIGEIRDPNTEGVLSQLMQRSHVVESYSTYMSGVIPIARVYLEEAMRPGDDFVTPGGIKVDYTDTPQYREFRKLLASVPSAINIGVPSGFMRACAMLAADHVERALFGQTYIVEKPKNRSQVPKLTMSRGENFVKLTGSSGSGDKTSVRIPLNMFFSDFDFIIDYVDSISKNVIWQE